MMIVRQLSLALFSDFANLHNPYVQVVKTCRPGEVTGKDRMCLAATAVCQGALCT